MQMVRRGDREHVEVREVAQDVVPRRLAEVGAWRVSGPFRELPPRASRRSLRARGHGDQLELHAASVARPVVEPDARELAGDAEALQVGVGAQVDVAAEHAGADEGDLDSVFHAILCRVAPDNINIIGASPHQAATFPERP